MRFLYFYRMYRNWGYDRLTAARNAWRKCRHA